MPNSVRGFLQPYLHLWHLLISWRLQVLSSRRLRRLLQTIADEYVFDRYAAEDSGWICCFVSDRVPVAECGKLYF